MATFTLSADTNIDALTGKTGGDTYSASVACWLTIDQHSRFGLNQSNASDIAATSIGALSNTHLLKLKIDGTKVRMIPFTGGAGNVPTLNTLIEIAGASGKLMCVYSTDMQVVPKVAGEAMPTDGWIQVKQWNSIEYSAGTLTGISATCSGVSKVGILEIIVDTTASGWYEPMLDMKGEWYELGVTDGTLAQTFQIPIHGTNYYGRGVYVETGVGTGIYEPYGNAKYGTNLVIGTEEARGKVCWLTETNGSVRLGSNDGITPSGWLPTAGRRVVIPNVYLGNVVSTTRRTITSVTHAIRYTSSNGVCGVLMDKCTTTWNLTTFSGTVGGFTISNSSLSYNGIGGQTNQLNANTITNCLAGRFTSSGNENQLTYTDCVFFQIQASTSQCTLSNGQLITFNNCRFQNTFVPALNAALPLGLSMATMKNIILNNCDFIGCMIDANTTTEVDINNIGICGVPFGVSVESTVLNLRSHINLYNLASDFIIDGLRILVAGTCANGQFVITNNYRASNIVIKNIGTFDAPIDFTTTYATKYLCNPVAGSVTDGVEIRDCYVSGMRGELYVGTGTPNNRARIFNSGSGYASSAVTLGAKHYASIAKGFQATMTSATGDTTSNGMISADCFDSTTSGIIIFFGAKQSEVKDKITLIGTTYYDIVYGGMFCPVAGDGFEIEIADYIIGHTGFKNLPMEMHNSNDAQISRFNLAYSIDVNDGNGFSAWVTGLTYITIGTSLSALTIDGTKGFKIKIRATAIATGTNNRVLRMILRTNSTVDAQKIKYPNPVLLPTITIDADESFLAGGTGKFAMYLDDMAGYQYGVNTTPVMDSYSNPIKGNITTTQTTFTFGYSMNMQGIRQKNEDTNVVIVATNPLYTQPIVVRGTITSTGLFVALTKSDDKAMIGGL